MYYVLDGMERGVARLVADNEEVVFAAAEKLPPQACEGDCLWMDGSGVFWLDAEETQRRRDRVKEKWVQLLHRKRR